MQAIIEYESSEIETIVGLQGFGRDVAKRILGEYDIVRMWLIQDDEDPNEADLSEEPYWSLDTYWVTREDGKTAKILLNNWHDDTDIWSAIDDDYPEAYYFMDECPESAEVVQCRTWDARFQPGEGEELAAWL